MTIRVDFVERGGSEQETPAGAPTMPMKTLAKRLVLEERLTPIRRTTYAIRECVTD